MSGSTRLPCVCYQPNATIPISGSPMRTGSKCFPSLSNVPLNLLINEQIMTKVNQIEISSELYLHWQKRTYASSKWWYVALYPNDQFVVYKATQGDRRAGLPLWKRTVLLRHWFRAVASASTGSGMGEDVGAAHNGHPAAVRRRHQRCVSTPRARTPAAASLNDRACAPKTHNNDFGVPSFPPFRGSTNNKQVALPAQP